MVTELTVRWPGRGAGESWWGHGKRNGKLGCGKWGWIRSVFLEVWPWFSCVGPFIKKRSEELSLLFRRLCQTEITSKWLLLSRQRVESNLPKFFCWLKLSACILQNGGILQFWQGKHRYRCRKAPGVIRQWIYPEVPFTSRSFHIALKSSEIPAEFSPLHTQNTQATVDFVNLFQSSNNKDHKSFTKLKRQKHQINKSQWASYQTFIFIKYIKAQTLKEFYEEITNSKRRNQLSLLRKDYRMIP